MPTASASRKADAPNRTHWPAEKEEMSIDESAQDDTPNMNAIGTAVIQHGFLLR